MEKDGVAGVAVRSHRGGCGKRGKDLGWIVLSKEAHPICDGKCAEALDGKGVATVAACRVRVQCVEAGGTNRQARGRLKQFRGRGARCGGMKGVCERSMEQGNMDCYYCQGPVLSTYHSNETGGSGVVGRVGGDFVVW